MRYSTVLPCLLALMMSLPAKSDPGPDTLEDIAIGIREYMHDHHRAATTVGDGPRQHMSQRLSCATCEEWLCRAIPYRQEF